MVRSFFLYHWKVSGVSGVLRGRCFTVSLFRRRKHGLHLSTSSWGDCCGFLEGQQTRLAVFLGYPLLFLIKIEVLTVFARVVFCGQNYLANKKSWMNMSSIPCGFFWGDSVIYACRSSSAILSSPSIYALFWVRILQTLIMGVTKVVSQLHWCFTTMAHWLFQGCLIVHRNSVTIPQEFLYFSGLLKSPTRKKT